MGILPFEQFSRATRAFYRRMSLVFAYCISNFRIGGDADNFIYNNPLTRRVARLHREDDEVYALSLRE